eukprot:scaffold97763_cov33-Tisochrysis_lutea.AAC.6
MPCAIDWACGRGGAPLVPQRVRRMQPALAMVGRAGWVMRQSWSWAVGRARLLSRAGIGAAKQLESGERPRSAEVRPEVSRPASSGAPLSAGTRAAAVLAF